MQALLDEVGEKGTKSASAIAFLATVMKENGALDECLELYRLANSLEPGPSGATYALNLFHALEVANRCREALVSIARAFFTRNASVAWFGAASRLLEGRARGELTLPHFQQLRDEGFRLKRTRMAVRMEAGRLSTLRPIASRHEVGELVVQTNCFCDDGWTGRDCGHPTGCDNSTVCGEHGTWT